MYDLVIVGYLPESDEYLLCKRFPKDTEYSVIVFREEEVLKFARTGMYACANFGVECGQLNVLGGADAYSQGLSVVLREITTTGASEYDIFDLNAVPKVRRVLHSELNSLSIANGSVIDGKFTLKFGTLPHSPAMPLIKQVLWAGRIKHKGGNTDICGLRYCTTDSLKIASFVPVWEAETQRLLAEFPEAAEWIACEYGKNQIYGVFFIDRLYAMLKAGLSELPQKVHTTLFAVRESISAWSGKLVRNITEESVSSISVASGVSLPIGGTVAQSAELHDFSSELRLRLIHSLK